MAELAANGPARRYTRTDEGWVADGDERDLALPSLSAGHPLLSVPGARRAENDNNERLEAGKV